MSVSIRPVDYFYATVKDRPGEAYNVLAALAESGVNLLAFNAVPLGEETTQLVLFPDSSAALTRVAAKAGMTLTGPERAILVQGDDRLGVLVDTHQRLAAAKVNVYAASGVTDGKGRFGYVVYVRGGQFDEALRALGL
jgi:predicted amino acid-binding ACT domain protein